MTTIPMPVEIDDVSMAFPADAALDYMPAYEDIPDEFKNGRRNPWVTFQSDWFYLGLAEIRFEPVEVDGKRLNGDQIFRQLRAIQGSYAPKHEHKMAAVAYLASLWMESLYYVPKGYSDPKILGRASLRQWKKYFKDEKRRAGK